MKFPLYAFAMLSVVACGNPSSQPAGASAPAPAETHIASTTPAGAQPATPPTGAATPGSSVPFANGETAFGAVRHALLENYTGAPVREDDLYRAAVQGMLEHVDPQRTRWNKLLTPEELAAMHDDLHGEVVGLGAQIHFDPSTGYSDVLGVFPGSPAEKAHVLAQDKILDVNGKLFKNRTLKEVLAEIRGKQGETVTLTILRADKLLTIPVVRERVALDATRELMLEGRVGYLQIHAFNAKTRPGVDQTLSDLESKKARALVVDMRGNPGGGFDDAIACADALLPQGATIVRVEKRGAKEQVFTAKGATALADVPMAVLVDGDTSSGGEFVTAALRDARHATIVGKKTFGKWTLQRIDDLPNGYAIKFTVGTLETAGGQTYDGMGLEPDVEVDADKKAMIATDTDPARQLATDTALRTALALLRR